ncbi:hypothetical protein AX15_005482, partial [Amanita polypyramis BW_CC]
MTSVTKMYTSTLPGGQVTVLSTVVESGVLSTSNLDHGSRFSHNTSAIIGVAVSATVGLILSVFVVFFSCTRYRTRAQQRQRQGRRRRQRRKKWRVGSPNASLSKGGSRSAASKRNGSGSGSVSVGIESGNGTWFEDSLPAGPLSIQGYGRGHGRTNLGTGMDSSADILGAGTSSELEDFTDDDEGAWRSPLAKEDDEEVGATSEVVRGAGISGHGYGYVRGVGSGLGTGVGLPTPPDSREGKGKSSLGHSQRRGGLSVAEEETRGTGSVSIGGDDREVEPQLELGNVLPGERRKKSSGASEVTVKAYGGTVASQRSENETLRGLGIGGKVVTVFETTAYEHETGSATPTTNSGSGTTTRTGTMSTTRSKSFKKVLDRIRTSVPGIQITPDVSGSPLTPSSWRNSHEISSGTIVALVGCTFVSKAGTGSAWEVRRPGYDYGGIVRPQQRQMVLERAFGQCQHPYPQEQPRTEGPGQGVVQPPPPVTVISRARDIQFPPSGAMSPSYPPAVASANPNTNTMPPPSLLLLPTSTDFIHPIHSHIPYGTIDRFPNAHGRSVDEETIPGEADEEDSLRVRGSVVRDGLLDPLYLRHGGDGSSPNIEGASLRDYVDYSRRIGG